MSCALVFCHKRFSYLPPFSFFSFFFYFLLLRLVFFSLWDRWKGLFVQPPFFLSLFFFSLHLDGHIRFFCPPPLFLFLLFIFSFFSSCWNRWEIFLSSPLSLSCFFLFSLSLCVEMVGGFFLSPLVSFPFFSFSWNNNVIFSWKRTSSFVTKLHKVVARSRLGPYKMFFFLVLTHKINLNQGTIVS